MDTNRLNLPSTHLNHFLWIDVNMLFNITQQLLSECERTLSKHTRYCTSNDQRDQEMDASSEISLAHDLMLELQVQLSTVKNNSQLYKIKNDLLNICNKKGNFDGGYFVFSNAGTNNIIVNKRKNTSTMMGDIRKMLEKIKDAQQIDAVCVDDLLKTVYRTNLLKMDRETEIDVVNSFLSSHCNNIKD